jgi:hypothetical protein
MTGAVLIGGIAMALMHETAPVKRGPNAVTVAGACSVQVRRQSPWR